MSSRMDKYKQEANTEVIPTRSDKNKELYKQIYNAYDEFENLIVPSNAREINPSELKKEITSRQDYRKKRDYDDITNNKTNNTIIRKEKILEEQKQEEEIYDINELLNKATSDNKKPELTTSTLANEDYLKKLKLDSRKTNIEQVKEMYDDIKKETLEEDEALMKTANLSLEILSDLKGDSDTTMMSVPIKNRDIYNDLDNDLSSDNFYGSGYEFSKNDFEDKENENDEDDVSDDQYLDRSGNRFLFKILMLIFGILLVVLVLIYFINYFNRV